MDIFTSENKRLKVINAKDYAELSGIAADMIAEQIKSKPNCVLGLATGSTPVGTYQNLVVMNKKGEIDFSGVTTVNLDEYCSLAPENDQSYRYFMDDNLFSRVNIDKSKTHVPDGTAADPETESRCYEELINTLGGIDLQLLGLGHNGHIGFNEPGNVFIKATHAVNLAEATIDANTRFFNDRNQVPKRAITMGIGTIMSAKKILLIVSGKDKADIIEKVLYGDITPNVPASVLQLHPDITVIKAVD